MGDTGFSSFNTTVQKTNKILKEIEQAYGLSKERRNVSYAALRSVLHALRDRLTVGDRSFRGSTANIGSRHLLSQLGPERGAGEDAPGRVPPAGPARVPI